MARDTGTNTGGITERDLIATLIEQTHSDIGDAIERHFALVWTTQYAGNITSNFQIFGQRFFYHLAISLDAFIDRAVDIFLGEGF